MKPHKHAEFIKAWADGQEIEYCEGERWFVTSVPTWRYDRKYRVKPAAPKWPQTTMTQDDLWSQIDNVRNAPALEAFANMVIARSCEDGHVVPADKVREIEAKARAEGMMEGSKWDADRDRMVARTAISTALHSRGLVWDSSELDRIMEFIPK